jgi:hypothetical protein
MTSTKCCDKCGKEINMKRIHIVWFPDNHAFSWICGCCYQECNQKNSHAVSTPSAGGCIHG